MVVQIGTGLPRKVRSILAVLMGVLLATTALLAYPAIAAGGSRAASPDEKVVLPVGHIDSPKVFWGDKGFELKANAGKLYDLDKTISWLRPNIYSGDQQFYGFAVGQDSPALDFLGKGTTWWAAPSNCISCGQIWQGYGADTDIPYEQFRDGAGVSAADAGGTFWLNLVSIDGPGRLEMIRGDKFEDEQWGTYRRIISSTEPGMRSAALKPGTHTHNWTLFSAPGDYKLVWQVSARKNDGTIITSQPTEQHWRIGGSQPASTPQPALAERFAKAAQGNTAGYSFSISTANDREAQKHGMTLASWNFSAPQDVNGKAEIYINGHMMSTLDVRSGKGSLTQLPAVGAAKYQVVFFPESKGARWVSEPLTYTPQGSPVTTQKSGELPVHDPASASTADFSEVDVPSNASASVKLSPGTLDTTFSVDVRMSDPKLRGDVVLDFFEHGTHSQYPDISYTGTLSNGRWTDQIEDLDSVSGLDVHFTFLPHSSMRNVHKKTAVVVTNFDPESTSTATVPLGAGDAVPGQGDQGGAQGDDKPGVEPTPSDPDVSPDQNESEEETPDDPDPDSEIDPDSETDPDDSSDQGESEGDTPSQPKPSQGDDLSGKRLLLDAGHVDLAAQLIDGELDMRVKDDTGLIDKKSTLRLPHAVALGVRNHAREVNTEKRIKQGFGFLGKAGSSAYILPETEKSGLIWPGYSTEALAEQVDYSSQHLNIALLDGPGDVKLYKTDFGKPTVLFDSAENDEAAIAVPGPVHVHTGWAFTKPGRYEVLFYFTAHTPDGAELTSVERSLVFLVGDEEIAKATDVVSAHSTDTSKPDVTPKPGSETEPQPKPDDTSKPDVTPTPKPDVTPKPEPQPEKPSEKITLDHGHTDIFNVSMTQGKLQLNLKEDVTGQHVAHTPEDVTLVVKSQALMQLPATYPAAPQAYVLPLNQDQALLWPGWSTLETQQAGLGAVDLEISKVDGPGAVHIFTQNFIGTPQPLLSNGATALPGTITVPEPRHVHAYWAFTKPGTYTMRVTAKAKHNGTLITSDTHTYTWIVQSAAGTADEKPHPNTPGHETPSVTPTPKPTPQPQAGSSSTSARKPASQPTSTAHKQQSNAPLGLLKGHVDAFFLNPTAASLDLVVREDVTGQSVLRKPEDVRFLVGDNAKMLVPAGFPNAGRQAWVLPMVQNPNLLWPGWSSERVRGSADFTVNVSGPGKVYVFTSSLDGKPTSVLRGGGLALPGTIHVPSPAHVHANWIFSAPGVYTFQVRGSADGQSTRTATYTFAVGNAAATQIARTTRVAGGSVQSISSAGTTDISALLGGATADKAALSKGSSAKVPLEKKPVQAGVCALAGNPSSLPQSLATSGHFDLGPQLRDGKLVAMIRDDRQQPAQWRPAGDVAFGLDAQALTTTPQELSFLAKPGTPMWMISSVQQPGVPWLGETSQHESIIAGTTGEVTTRITKIQGPGEVAHFLPTALGTGVGTMLFSTVKGPNSYVIPANTHMHGVWAFTAPGEYVIFYQHEVTDKAGKKLTADGKLTIVVGSCDQTAAANAQKAANASDTALAQAGLGTDQGRGFDVAWWIQTALLAAVLLTNVIVLIRWSQRRRQIVPQQ